MHVHDTQNIITNCTPILIITSRKHVKNLKIKKNTRQPISNLKHDYKIKNIRLHHKHLAMLSYISYHIIL